MKTTSSGNADWSWRRDPHPEPAGDQNAKVNPGIAYLGGLLPFVDRTTFSGIAFRPRRRFDLW